MRNLRVNLESQVESIKDLYNKAKREIAGLHSRMQDLAEEKRALEGEGEQVGLV